MRTSEPGSESRSLSDNPAAANHSGRRASGRTKEAYSKYDHRPVALRLELVHKVDDHLILMRLTIRIPELRTYYQRKRAQGKTHEVALSYLMRFLTRRLVAVLRSGKPYQSQYNLKMLPGTLDTSHSPVFID